VDEEKWVTPQRDYFLLTSQSGAAPKSEKGLDNFGAKLHCLTTRKQVIESVSSITSDPGHSPAVFTSKLLLSSDMVLQPDFCHSQSKSKLSK